MPDDAGSQPRASLPLNRTGGLVESRHPRNEEAEVSTLTQSFIALSLALLTSASAAAVDGVSGEPRADRTEELQAVRFSDSAETATRLLNELAGQGWQYVGPLGNGLVAFRRTTPIDPANSSLQGEWEFLSYEKDGVVTEYKPEQRLKLSIAGDNWTVGDQVRQRVEMAGRELLFRGLTDGLPGAGPETPQATIAFGIFEVKGESLTYCMTPAVAGSAFAPDSSPVMKPHAFETRGTPNVVYRLRKK